MKQYLLYRNPKTPLPKEKYKFYQEMLKVWKKYKKFELEQESTVRKEALWFNQRISPGSSGILWLTWQDKGIEKIGDICHTQRTGSCYTQKLQTNLASVAPSSKP